MTVYLHKAIPFFWVTDMSTSLRFYRDVLGFRVTRQWIPEDGSEYPNDGQPRWCRLEWDDVAIMLQMFMPGHRTTAALGQGISIVFECVDALAVYRQIRSNGGHSTRPPKVGNGFWVVPLVDPDGYRLEFASPTDAAEDTELAEQA